MKILIKKLLRETFDKYYPEIYEDNPLFIEGKKYFPKLRFMDAGTKYEPNRITTRVFKNYPKNKGSYSLGGFKSELTHYKINKIYKWISTKGAKDMVMARTGSIYFTFKNKKIRISNHTKNSFNGVDILVKWDTTPKEITQKLNEKFN